MICKRSTWKHLIEALFLLMLVSGLVFFCFACSPCEHSDAEWVIDEEATLDSEGSRHLECPSCGQTISTESIPMLELTEAEIKKKLSHSLVKVLTYDYDGKTELAQGSGFFINRTGTFITNAHVVENCYYIKIKSYLGTTYDVDCMYAYNYDSSDYAICKAKNCYSSSLGLT